MDFNNARRYFYSIFSTPWGEGRRTACVVVTPLLAAGFFILNLLFLSCAYFRIRPKYTQRNFFAHSVPRGIQRGQKQAGQ